MTSTDNYLSEIFRAQLALYRLHHKQHDIEEANDDVKRADIMFGNLALRYPYQKCQFYFEKFNEGVQAS